MAVARIRNDTWKEDLTLKEILNKYVKEGFRREEILDFMFRDFEGCAWSLRTLDRRLQYFEIHYTDIDTTVEQVEDAVKLKMEGPGKLLGYRAMQKKLRQVHGLRVPRDFVHAVMYNVDPDALEERASSLLQEKEKERSFHNTGNKLGSFPWWPRQVNGLPKQHLSDCCLWLHRYLQSETALGKGLDEQ